MYLFFYLVRDGNTMPSTAAFPHDRRYSLLCISAFWLCFKSFCLLVGFGGGSGEGEGEEEGFRKGYAVFLVFGLVFYLSITYVLNMLCLV